MADVHIGLEGDANLNIGNARNKEGDGTSIQATVGRDWRDSNGIRTKLITNASNEYVGGEFIFCRDSSIGGDSGFESKLEYNDENPKDSKVNTWHKDGDLAWIDGAKIWWTPTKQFKFWVGQGTHDDIRGDAGYGANGFCTPLNAGEYKDGWTFIGQGVRGVSVGVFPIEGLIFYGSWEIPMGRERESRYDWDNGDNTFRSEPQNIFARQAKYCAAYEIKEIGAVKVGIDECVPSAKKDGQLGFYVGAGVDYPIMDTVKLNMNTSYANGIYLWDSSADHMDCFDVALSIAKEFPNCCVSEGFAGSITTRILKDNGDTRQDVHAMYDTTYKKSNGDIACPFSWGVPLHIAFWF